MSLAGFALLEDAAVVAQEEGTRLAGAGLPGLVGEREDLAGGERRRGLGRRLEDDGGQRTRREDTRLNCVGTEMNEYQPAMVAHSVRPLSR